MNILLLRFFLLQFTISFADHKEVVSEEKQDVGRDRRQDTVDFDSHRSNRRYEIDEEDEEWHIAHLKNRDVALGNSRCKAETLEDRIARYKQSLREDASLLEFVSVDAIPVDEKDIEDPCLSKLTEVERRNEGKDSATTEVPNGNSTLAEEQKANITVDDILLKPATSANVKGDTTPGDEEKSADGEKIRRSEYQFSSIEYYEETVDFDAEQCPDEVDVITLQVDELKKFDIECELIIEWKSLE